MSSSSKIVLTFNLDKNILDEEVKTCILKVRLISVSNSEETISNYITGETLYYKKVQVEFYDNLKKRVINDNFLFFKTQNTPELNIDQEYWGRITRSKKKDGMPKKVMFEIFDGLVLNPEMVKIDYSKDLSLQLNSSMISDDNIYFNSQPKLPNTFYTNFLHYPFIRPPHSIWFDGTINHSRIGIVPKDKKEYLKDCNKGYEITPKMIQDGKVKKYLTQASLSYFISVLNNYFPGMIYTGIGEFISKKGYKTFYLLPDILLYDKRTNLHIAIDIDVPYDLETRTMKKFIKYNEEIEESSYGGNYKLLDYYGDVNLLFSESFYNNGQLYDFYENMEFDQEDDFVYGPFKNFSSWFYFKFSEKQIILHSNECCKYINEQIFKLMHITLSNEHFENISHLEKEDMWNLETAEKMMKQKYREKLLEWLPKSNISSKNYSSYKSDYFEWASKNNPDLLYDLPF